VVSGLVQLEASLGSSVAGAAESDRLTPDIPVDHAEQTPAADRHVAGHEEDDDAVSEAGVDEPVDATLVEDEAGNGSGGAKDVTAVKGNTVPCTDCQASGACSKCDGKGKRLLFRCSRCGGSGLCPTCGGPGFLWQ
jgi:hypothetical protein